MTAHSVANHRRLLICVCAATLFGAQPQWAQPVGVVPASAAPSVEKVEVSSAPGGLTIKITASAAVMPTAHPLKEPDRLVLDFPGCELKVANRQIAVNHGPVRDLRMSAFSVHPLVARIVVDLSEPVDFKLRQSGTEILIEIPFPKAVAAAARVRKAATVEKQPDAKDKTDRAEELAALAVPAPKPTEPENRPRAGSWQVGAYALMDKAKKLNVGDLEPLEQKADAGDPDAQTMLALAYHAGILLRQDDSEALRLLRKAADKGSMAAEESLGIFAETGIGMKPAPSEAMNWYQRAAQRGSLDAATNIGLMYANGRGVSKDNGQAITWFQRAAVGGDASAQYDLALMYERGEGVPQDYKEAVRWLTPAAEQNLIPAILDLAEISLRPPIPAMNADVSRAMSYYEKAANLGSPVAQSALGTIFMRGLNGKADYDQAVKWFRKAADQGNADGELGLGVSYALGHGVPTDYEEARRLLTAAANQGQVEAQYDLGVLCEEGKGAPPDRNLAAHYYQMAAEQGSPKAQYRYGLLLAKNNGSRSDRVAAYKWLMLTQGSIKESSAALSNLRKSMSDQEISEADQEVDQWRLAHKRDDPPSLEH